MELPGREVADHQRRGEAVSARAAAGMMHRVLASSFGAWLAHVAVKRRCDPYRVNFRRYY